MRKRVLFPLALILLGSVFLLTACGNQTGSNPKFTPRKTMQPTTVLAPIGKVIDGTTILPNGLIIPPLGQSIPIAPLVQGHPEISSTFVNGAYAFALGFVYKSYNMPDIWEPNTKKNPQYMALLNSEFNNLGSYLSPEMQQTFLLAVPNLINPIDPSVPSGFTFNSDAKIWGHLVLLPMRNKDGSLQMLSNPVYYSLMYPWTLGYSVGAPVTSVTTISKYGQVLNLRFSYSIELIYGNQKNVKGVWKVSKTASFDIIPNPDASMSKSNPYLIAGFGQDNNATFTKVAKDPRLAALVKMKINALLYP